MKRFLLCLSIALVTFFVGIGLTSVFLSFTQVPYIKAVENIVVTKPHNIINGVEIEYKWTLKDKYGRRGVFVVTNRSDRPIYYSGYEKNSHVINWIRQNGEREDATKLPCFNGVEQQELLPRETAIFEIPVPNNRKPFEAGFLFTIDNEYQSFWVMVEKQSKFSVTYSK